MSSETRDTLLFSQLQEGLQYELVKAPAVSGAQGYQQLCLAARNEERRLLELDRRRQYSKVQASVPSSPWSHRQSQPTTFEPQAEPPSDAGARRNSSQATLDSSQRRLCFQCHQPGHFARNCPTRRRDNITSSPRDTSRPAQTNQVCSQLETPQKFETPTYQPSTSAPNPNEREFDTLRVEDRGSKTRHAHVLVEGVPTDGVIDSGADITIMGGALFRQVVAVGKIKCRSLWTKYHELTISAPSHWMERWIWILHSAGSL